MRGYSHGFSWRTNQGFWDYDLIENKIQEAMSILNIHRFPTANELLSIDYGGLVNVITRTGGFIYWHKRLNMEKIDKKESEIGWQGEDIVEAQLISLGFKVEKQKANCPYDFVVNNTVRIDSKYSHLYHGELGNFYSCNLESCYRDCDIYVIICEDDKGVQRFLIIPHTAVFNHKQISIGEYDSKWYKYENKFNIIKKYSDFYNSLQGGFNGKI